MNGTHLPQQLPTRPTRPEVREPARPKPADLVREVLAPPPPRWRIPTDPPPA